MSEEERRPRTVCGPTPSAVQRPEDGHCCGHVCVPWDFQSHSASGVGLPPLFFSSACLCSFFLTSLATKRRTISILKHTPTRTHNTQLLLGGTFWKNEHYGGLGENPQWKGLEPWIAMSHSPMELLITLAGVWLYASPWKTTVRLHVCGLYNKDAYGRDCVCLKPPCLGLYKDPSDLSHSLQKSAGPFCGQHGTVQIKGVLCLLVEVARGEESFLLGTEGERGQERKIYRLVFASAECLRCC